MKKIKILFADDHIIVRNGIKLMLSKQNSFEADIDEASDGVEAIFKATSDDYDIILLDVNLPLKDCIEVTKTLKAKLGNPRILALTMHKEEFIIKEILKAGALGYLLKSAGIEELTKAIKTVYDYKQYYCNEVSQLLISGQATDETNHTYTTFLSTQSKNLDVDITKREYEVLKRITAGYTDKEISAQLNISTRTVGNHRQHLIQKLQVKNSIELVAYALRNGIVT
ncbi:MAG: response regulator transcription factor [Crocinitomicaceae bacterium]|nr:response regulator transcription factor [Crocinitomicaceae bacterium]